MSGNATQKAAKAAGMISVMILISRILGFVRETISGRFFSRFETDAYIAAFIIPDTMYYLLVGGALAAAFIPIFTEYLARDQEEEGWKVASTFINMTVLLLLLFTVFGMIFARGLAPIEAPDFGSDKTTGRVDARDVSGGLFYGIVRVDGRRAELLSLFFHSGFGVGSVQYCHYRRRRLSGFAVWD